MEYLTYVLWAVTPEGRANNLGEIVLSDGKSEIRVTTDLQAPKQSLLTASVPRARRNSTPRIMQKRVRSPAHRRGGWRGDDTAKRLESSIGGVTPTRLQRRLRQPRNMPRPMPASTAPVSFLRSVIGTKRVC